MAMCRLVKQYLTMKKLAVYVLIVTISLSVWQLYFIKTTFMENGVARKARIIVVNNRIYHLAPSHPMWSWLESDNIKQTHVFRNFGHKFAYLRHVTVDSHEAFGKHGGEPVEEVFHQDKHVEFLRLSPGYFKLPCNYPPASGFYGNYLELWLNVTICETRTKNRSETDDVIDGYTIAVQRYEYTSFLYSMAAIYNAFLTLLVLNTTPPVNVMFVDAHPYNAIDEVWSSVFGKIVRAGHLAGKVTFENMIWNIPEQDSFILQPQRRSVPFLEEFKQFIFSAYLVTRQRPMVCGKLSLLFVWRRDYITHARNPKGNITQKIVNEQELLSVTQNAFPSFDVTGYQMDSLTMESQLQLIAHTHILVGMSGSGLAHALFLQQNGGIIEVKIGRPNSVVGQFEALARWRGLKYGNLFLDGHGRDHYVYVPPRKMTEIIRRLVSSMC